MKVTNSTKVTNLTKFRQILHSSRHPKGMGTTDVTNSTKGTNLTKFRQILTFKQTTQRDGYNKSGEFDVNNEFDESDKFDEISPDINIQANILKGGVQQK